MALERDFPGFVLQIRTLRAQGFTEDEILRSLSSRAQFLRESGASGEAVDAYLKGRPNPLETAIAGTMGTPGAADAIKVFEQQTRISPSESRGWMRARDTGTPVDQGNVTTGLISGIVDAALASGRVFADEIAAAPQQFFSGVGKVIAPESSILERVGGALETALAPVRGVFAPFTAVTRPTWERAVKPLMESVGISKSVTENPLVQVLGETVLTLPFGGIPKVTPAAELGTKAMLKEQQLGEAAMRSLRKKGKGIPVETAPTEAASVEATLAEVERAPTGVSRLGSKISTPEGPATVVAKTPDETVVVKTLQDEASTLVRNLEDLKAESTSIARPIKEGGGAPLAKIAPGFSTEQAQVVAARRISRLRNIPFDTSRDLVSRMPESETRTLAAQELRDFRISEGELTGKRGRPKKPEALQLGEQRTASGFDTSLEPAPIAQEPSAVFREMMPEGAAQTLQERTRAGRVQLPERTTLADVGMVPIETMRKVADQKGYDFQLLPREGGGTKVRLIGSGGQVHEFPTLREANGFLLVKGDKARQPVELKTTSGESTLEAVFQEKPLTREQQLNLQKQKALTREQRPLETEISDLPVTEKIQPVREFKLAPGQRIGTVEDLKTRPEALRAFRQARDAGFQSRLISTPDGGYEVAFYREATPDVSKAVSLHRMLLNKGVKALTEEEHRYLGKAFGFPDARIEEFIKDFVRGGKAGSEGGFVSPDIFKRMATNLDPTRPGGGTLRFANPTAGGLVSGSPIIRSATKDFLHAELARVHELKGWQQQLVRMKELVPDTKKAFQIKEGNTIPASDNERRFLELSRDMTVDFARRARAQGLLKEAQVLENYAPHLTDMDAVYDTFRRQFLQTEKYQDLSPQLKTKLTQEDFTRFKDTFLQHPSWRSVPRDTMRQIRSEVFDFSDVVSSTANLPEWIKNKLPDHLFNRFFLPRERNAPPLEDFYQAMGSYIGRTTASLHFDPLMSKWQPIIDALPGSGVPFTERGFLEKLVTSAIVKRPTWDQRTIGYLLDRTNSMIGRDLMKLDDVNAASQLIKNSFMRGALGPDSSIHDYISIVGTWAEGGRVIGPLFKYVQAKGRSPAPGIITEFLPTFGPEVTKAGTSVMRHALNIDRKLTTIVLSPLHLSENVVRGISAWAGIEEAAAKGLNGAEALKVGFARASEVVPNLMLTQQQLHAIEFAGKVRPGGLGATTRAPMFQGVGPVGRLSTTLLTVPTHVAQFMQLGLREGFADAMLRHDPARLLRYLAFTGFTFGLPYVMHKMGADPSAMLGPNAFGLVVGLPFFRLIVNGVNAVSGYDPVDRRQAQREVKEALTLMAVPQYRYGSKVKRVYENVERGYAVDTRGRFMYSTTPYGEIMSLLGIPSSSAYDTRKLARTLHETAVEYRFDHQEAIDGLLGGDQNPAVTFTRKWGRPITMEDLQKAMMQRMLSPAQRAAQGLPKELQVQELAPAGEVPASMMRR